MDKVKQLSIVLKILQDINEDGVGNFGQDVVLKEIEKEIAMIIVAMEVKEKYSEIK